MTLPEMIKISRHDVAILAAIVQARIRTILVGSFAMQAHGADREPNDIDLMVAADTDADGLIEVLRSVDVGRLEAPSGQIGFRKQINLPGCNVELITPWEDDPFDQWLTEAMQTALNDVRLPAASLPALAAMKRRAVDTTRDEVQRAKHCRDLELIMALQKSRSD